MSTRPPLSAVFICLLPILCRGGIIGCGQELVDCRGDPCEHTSCPGGETCVSNNCRGCNAECIPEPNSCPEGIQLHSCLLSPCHFGPCANGEICRATYCGGCKADCIPYV